MPIRLLRVFLIINAIAGSMDASKGNTAGVIRHIFGVTLMIIAIILNSLSNQ